MSNKYKVYPRSKVEKLVIEFIEEHKIYAQYGKDSEGLFNVQFLVKEENYEQRISTIHQHSFS